MLMMLEEVVGSEDDVTAVEERLSNIFFFSNTHLANTFPLQAFFSLRPPLSIPVNERSNETRRSRSYLDVTPVL